MATQNILTHFVFDQIKPKVPDYHKPVVIQA